MRKLPDSVGHVGPELGSLILLGLRPWEGFGSVLGFRV